MQVYPAIDLRNGQCVRLRQGKFDQETRYSDDPFATAQNFLTEGANWLHLIDLDGAKDPAQTQFDLIADLIKTFDLEVQTGGGIRNIDDIKKLLNAGATRVIVGSQAVNNSTEVKEWLKKFGKQRLVLAFDIEFKSSEPFIATHGWQHVSDRKLDELLDYYQADLSHVLCTDISRDGTLTGPNVELYQNLQKKYPQLNFQASGGISSLIDIHTLRQQKIAGAVVGRALYENKFSLKEALVY